MKLQKNFRAVALLALILSVGFAGSERSLSWAKHVAHHVIKSATAKAASTKAASTKADVASDAGIKVTKVRSAKLGLPTPPPPPPDSNNAFSKLRVRNLGKIVNSSDHDFGETVTADGRTMFFVSRRPGGKGLDDFWMTTCAEGNDTDWTAPINVGDINSEFADGAASIASDGQTIYFATNRGTTGRNDVNIWTATLDGIQWKNVREVGAPVNTSAWESQPSISPDGKKLFFTSSRDPHYGPSTSTDIFVARQLPDGRWGEPVNLGSKINTTSDEGSPFIAADGTTLYFFSRRPGGLGKADLYSSEFKGPSDTDWTEPVALPAPINSPAEDMFLTVPASGDVLYFTSNRDGGSGNYDIWQATNPPKPKPSLVLRGTCYDMNTKEKLGAHVVITDAQTGDTMYNKFANSSTGEYLAVFSANAKGELGGSYLISATEPNHFPYKATREYIPLRDDTSRIVTHDIPMTNENPPHVEWHTTTPQLMVEHPDKYPGFKGVIIREQQTIELFTLLPMLFFDEGAGMLPSRYVLYSSPDQTNGFSEDTLSSTLNSYYNYLNILGERLRKNPKSTFRMVGSISMDVAKEQDIKVSQQRVEFVKNYLVSIWGIDAGRIKTEAKKLPENARLATTPEGIEENRRVQVYSDDWEIVHPVLFKQNVKRPDQPVGNIGMVNGLRDETIANRELDISYHGQPWAVLSDLGPVTTSERRDWNWRSQNGNKLPQGEDDFEVVLKVTDKTGRVVSSNVDKIGVRQFSVSDVVAEHLSDKTRETYNLVLFEYNSAEMGKWNHKILDAYVYDRIQPNSDVTINGYTDILGTDDYDEKLSIRRSDAVKKDIDGHVKGRAKTIVSHGYGKTNPLYTNSLPEGRNYNRTVQVLVETPINAAP